MNRIQGPKDKQFARFSPRMRSISCAMAIKAVVFFLAVLLFIASGAWARPTTEDEARNAAENWLSREAQPMGARVGRHVEKVQAFAGEAGDPAYYVVHLLPSGLIFLPADDQVEPIIGFVSDATSYDPTPANPLGALVSRDIPGRVAHVKETEASALRSGETSAAGSRMAKARNKWASLAEPVVSSEGAGSTLSSISDVRVAPFVQSRWNQGRAGPLACYNYFTPPYEPGNAANYICGCAATALAQVMRYWQYPSAGIGVVSENYSVDNVSETGNTRGGNDKGGPYHWGSMPLKTSSTTTSDQRKAIGRLTWDVGLSLGSNYSSTGTGTGFKKPHDALVKTFHYGNAKYGNNSGNNLPEDNLYSMVNPNLHAKYPVVFGIEPNGGHFVVCDGYGYNDSTIYHHLNMGWSGGDDAWYNLPTIDAVANNDLYTSIAACTYNIYTSGKGEIIAGRVTDSAGNPISGAKVQRKGLSGSKNSTTTDANGIYAFTKVPSATDYTVTASKTGYLFTPLTASTGTSANDTTTTGNVWGVDFAAYLGPPTAPRGVKAVAGKGQASVRFTAPASNGGCPIEYYTVTSNHGDQAQASARMIIVTDLIGHTIYTFTVTATNIQGTSPASIPSNPVEVMPPKKPVEAR